MRMVADIPQKDRKMLAQIYEPPLVPNSLCSCQTQICDTRGVYTRERSDGGARVALGPPFLLWWR